MKHLRKHLEVTVSRIAYILCLRFSLIFLLLAVNVSWAESSEPYGVALFGEVGIHGDGVLAAGGDVFLKDATVLGSGTLLMTDRKVRYLTALHSIINNLEIKNPVMVKLVGDLHIEHKLTVSHGALDAGNAVLTLGYNCVVDLFHGARLVGTACYGSRDQPVSYVNTRYWPGALTGQFVTLSSPYTIAVGHAVFGLLRTYFSAAACKQIFSPPENAGWTQFILVTAYFYAALKFIGSSV